MIDLQDNIDEIGRIKRGDNPVTQALSFAIPFVIILMVFTQRRYK